MVWGLLVAGQFVALGLGYDPIYGLIPGAAAGAAQHIAGHAVAWRRGGVERAFIMESSAISFYFVAVALVVAAVLEVTDVREIGIHWLAIGAFYVDTIVRSVREHRFV